MYWMECDVYMENMYVAWSLPDYPILNYLVCMFKYASSNIEIKCQKYGMQDIRKIFRKFMRAYPIFFLNGFNLTFC